MQYKGKCVVREWVFNLSFKQQTVLLCALRGCDNVDKYDLSKEFIRALRNVVLYNAGVEGSEFVTSNATIESAKEFSKCMDKYPIHFILHFVHAAEVIGYNHPEKEVADWWLKVYEVFVNAFHMNLETKEENDVRLRDGVDTCCHKT